MRKIFVCLLLAGCASSLTLDDAEIKERVDDAVADGDCRFSAVYGIGITTPGVEPKQFWKVERYGVNPIPGTSDYIKDEEQAEKNRIADEYSRKYNKYLLNKIDSEADKCKEV